MKKILTILLLVALISACSDDDKELQKSNEKIMIEFTIDEISGSIDQTSGTVAIELPHGTSLSSLAPAIVVSDKATVSPSPGQEQDFTQPVVYTVTAEDDSKQAYTVTVTIGKSPRNDILGFFILVNDRNISGSIDHQGKVINMEVPIGMDVTQLKPVVNISAGATVSPASGEVQDFTEPVIYTVTAENGSQQEYIVIIRDEVANAEPQIAITVIDRTRVTRQYLRFGYDNPKRRLVSYTETDPENLIDEKNMCVTQITYNDNGQVVSIVEKDNAETARETVRTFLVSYLDDKTIEVVEKLPDGSSLVDKITLNGDQRVAEFIQNGKSQKFEYDKNGNMTKQTDADGSYQIVTYDNKNGVFRHGNVTPHWVWLYTVGRLASVGGNNFLSIKEYTSAGTLKTTDEYKYVYNPSSWYPNAYKREGDKNWVVMFYQAM